MKVCFILIGPVSRRQSQTVGGKGAERQERSSTADGAGSGATTLENGLALSRRVDTSRPLCPTAGHEPTAGCLWTWERLPTVAGGVSSTDVRSQPPKREPASLLCCHLPWMTTQNHCNTGGETEAWRGKGAAQNTMWGRKGSRGGEEREGERGGNSPGFTW